MAFEHDGQYIAAGVTVDPRDLMVNVKGVAGEMGGHLDRDNVPSGAPIVPAKWAVQAIMSTGSNPVGGDGSGTALQTLLNGQTGTWTTITPLTTTVPTDDGAIKVAMDVNWTWPGAVYQTYNDRLEVRLLIDGRVMSSSGWSTLARLTDSASLTGYAPTTAGTVTISVQMRAYMAPYTHLNDIRDGINVSTNSQDNPTKTSVNIDILGGNVVWEHRKR